MSNSVYSPYNFPFKNNLRETFALRASGNRTDYMVLCITLKLSLFIFNEPKYLKSYSVI